MRRPVRWLVGTLTGLVALAGLAVWRAHAVADATIERHLGTFRASVAHLQANPMSRPALLTPEESGDAEDLVVAYLTSVAAVPRVEWEKVEECGWGTSTPHDPVVENAVIDRVRAPMQALGRQWYRSRGPYALAEVGVQATPGTSGIPLSQTGQKAMSAAVRLALIAGRGEEAVLLASDLALLGHDTSGGRTAVLTFVGLGIEALGLHGMASVIRDLPLSSQVLASVAERLRALRESRPTLDSIWRVDRTVFEGSLADDRLFAQFEEELLGPDWHDSLRTWKSLYSTRIARSNALRELELLPERLPSELSSVPSDGAVERTIRAYALDADDPMIPRELDVWRMLLDRLEERDARFTALELAVAIARFEAERGTWPVTSGDLVPGYLPAMPTSPLDPTGLRFEGNKAWSRGWDRDDDGGTPVDPDSLDGDGDFVFEVKGHK